MIRSFLLYASHHTVEEVQAFTGQWVPHPAWTRTENVLVPKENITKAAELLIAELGESGIKAVGGQKWWQWRKKDDQLKAEWIEMRADYNARQREKKKCRRIMLYVHGGAYFFGSVDEHRYQLQRHARKLQARVFAPRYRLAPQFPFPCGMLDCLAAYLYLLTIHEPSEIILAGDSAGGGMVLSILCLLRDQQMPLPAGAILISPWVDLTHSFPSLSREDGFDYIPPHGFMHKPSRSWPPPNEDEIYDIVKAANGSDTNKPTATVNDLGEDRQLSLPEATRIAGRLQPSLCLQLDGKQFLVKDQVQLYTTNQLITHPLVSPALQPSLGGLPPLLILVGDGELLRDEQIYVAHKAADPQKYKLNDLYRKQYDPDDVVLNKYPPTPVQLQVWEDLCHVTPTLSFTRPAKFMYRSIAQFGAWALSRAQKRAIEIIDDDDRSSADSVSSKSDLADGKPTPNGQHAQIGMAGDPIPPFKNNMVREQVDRHGNIYPLPQATELPALQMSPDLVGVVKEGPIRRWLAAKEEWDKRYHSQRRKIHKQRVEAYKQGNKLVFGENEFPPPSALAGRLYEAEATSTQRLKKSWGLGLWSSWGWKEDEKTVHKDEQYIKREEKKERSRSFSNAASKKDDIGNGESMLARRSQSEDRRSFVTRRKTLTVQDEGQIEGEEPPVPPVPSLLPQQTSSSISTPALTVDPPTPNTEGAVSKPQQVSPIFLPKWKQASHLKNDSKDVSDAGSTYSQVTMQDNASTRAIFCAPGVQRQSSNTPDISVSGRNTPTAEGMSSPGFTPTTPGPKDNLGGYDTPVSRRSVERLQNHQMDIHDDRSVHSSLLPEKQTLNSRVEPLRSPSSMAVVHAEGIIKPKGEDLPQEDQSLHDVQQTNDDGGYNAPSVRGIPIHSTKDEAPPRDLGTQPECPKHSLQRPGLYGRDDQDFVTALERL